MDLKINRISRISRKFTSDGQPVFLHGEVNNGAISTNLQDFYKIRQRCAEDRKLFEDPEFPATMKSIFYSEPSPNRSIVWKRPSEISKNPQFSIDDFTRFDIQQGEIGDCWFLAAVASLTQDPKLLSRVVCVDNSFHENYAGIFHFRFWQFGKWVDVVVDDRLPTVNGKLLFMHSSNKDEFWSPLLEKAYAKLHGSYQSLRGGITSDAMEDFTGGVSENYNLNRAPNNLFNIIVKGFERGSMMGCSIIPNPKIVEAKTPEGLVKGHAYTVTKVQELNISSPQGKVQLIRLRNPWGNEVEWNGAWSDRSKEWQQVPSNVKLELALTISYDGEFWMSFKDFLKHFDDLDICHLSPDAYKFDDDESEISCEKEWILNSFEGEWVTGVSAGGCQNYADSFHSNPQYIMTLQDPDEDDDDENCTVIISLMQKNRRKGRHIGVQNLSIGFAIYSISERSLSQIPLTINFFRKNSQTASSDIFLNSREICCRFKLPPAHYVIVPSTFEPSSNGEFLIRVFTEGMCQFKEHDHEMIKIGKPSKDILVEIPEKSEIENLFNEIAVPSPEIGWTELKLFLDRFMQNDADLSPADETKAEITLKKTCMRLFTKYILRRKIIKEGSEIFEFSNEVCRSLVALMDADRSGKLGLDETHTLLGEILKWKAVFKIYDTDRSNRLDVHELEEAFVSAGYHLNKSILNEIAFRYGSSDLSITFDDFVLCAVKLKTMLYHFKVKDRTDANKTIFTLTEWIKKSIFS